MPPRRPNDCFAASKHGQYTAALFRSAGDQACSMRSYAMRKVNRLVTTGTLTALMTCGTVAFAQKQATIFVTVVAPVTAPVAGLKAGDFVANGGKLEVKD